MVKSGRLNANQTGERMIKAQIKNRTSAMVADSAEVMSAWAELFCVPKKKLKPIVIIPVRAGPPT